jgi:hypothetical protein
MGLVREGQQIYRFSKEVARDVEHGVRARRGETSEDQHKRVSYNEGTLSIKLDTGTCRSISRGLWTLVPEEMERSALFSGGTMSIESGSERAPDPKRVEVVNALISYQIALNDRIDYAHAGREDLSDLVQSAKTSEATAKQKLQKALEVLDSEEVTELVQTSIADIELAERHFHLYNRTPSFHDVERHRCLVDACYVYQTSAIIFGGDRFADKMQGREQEDSQTWDSLLEKYRWIMNGDYSNEAQRAVTIMYNLTMAANVYDDLKGYYIDRKLGIASLASAALEEKQGDRGAAKGFLLGIKASYEKRARDLGLSLTAQKGFDLVQWAVQEGLTWVTTTAKHGKNPYLKALAERGIDAMEEQGPYREAMFVRDEL